MRYQYEYLLRAYLDTKQSCAHEDSVKFYQARLKALENAFGVKILPGSALSVLFRAVADRYGPLEPTRAGFLDDSLINTTLQQLPDHGKTIEQAEQHANELIRQAQASLFKLLKLLLHAMGPPTRESVTSEELLALGFDDSKEPRTWDNYDDT
jgi:hypothetical protein